MNTAQDELEGRISLFTTPPSFNRNRQGRFIEASPRERERPGLPLWENENPAGSKFLSKRIPCEIFSYLSFRFIKKKKKKRTSLFFQSFFILSSPIVPTLPFLSPPLFEGFYFRNYRILGFLFFSIDCEKNKLDNKYTITFLTRIFESYYFFSSIVSSFDIHFGWHWKKVG